MRQRRIFIWPESLLGMFTEGAETHLRVVVGGLPAGTKFVRVIEATDRAGIELVVEHESFDPLKNGDVIPVHHPQTRFEDARSTLVEA